MEENKLTLLLNQIGMEEKNRIFFENGILERIIGNKKKDSYHFLITISSTLPVSIYEIFLEKLKISFPQFRTVKVTFHVKEKKVEEIENYFAFFIKDYIKEEPMFEMFLDDSITLEDDTLKIEVDNLAEKMKLERKISDLTKRFESAGFGLLEIEVIINEEQSKKVREEIKESLKKDTKKVVDKVKKEEVDPIIMGSMIKGEILPIKDIIGEENNLIVEVKVFGTIDYFESAKSNFKIITLRITDDTDSMYCKVFAREEEDYKNLKSRLKSGNWYQIRGYSKHDPYSKEIVLNARDITEIEKEESSLMDHAEEKRVELHAHTKMSQMDGVVDEVDLLKQAIQWGHKAIAITDHNGCQAFPHVFNFVTGHNKGKEEKDKLKAIYGTELTMIDDSVDIVLRPNNTVLLENTYIVFDFETTGFNAGGKDSIIEIGAVKLQNGEVIEHYDELINPGRKLPSKIVELTNITDEMLEDKDTEENAMKRFQAWIKDYPMVAHNAKFDVSFLEMAYQKYHLGEFKNPVIDTLELSRALDTGYARHSLSALVKRYDVPWDEDAHHRGDYDAEGTALVFHKMLKKLDDRNIEKMKDLDKLVSKDEIYKYGRAYHINLLAKNKVGLKNLFKLVSLANTTYLYKTPRILRSKVNELREGLLVGSGCYESEVFTEARSKSEEELTNTIHFYDYVEVQSPECYTHLLQMGDFGSNGELLEHLRKIIRVTEAAGKLVVATGDVHHLKREDRIYREIMVNQKVPGGGRHPLARGNITSIPSNHFRTTEEMLEDFSFLGEDLAKKIVVENTNQIADMVEFIEVIPDTKGIPFSPRVRSDDGESYLDCPVVVTNLVYDKAHDWYGDPLPENIAERISKELYGDTLFETIKKQVEKQNLKEEELRKKQFEELYHAILKGKEYCYNLVTEEIKKEMENASEEEQENLKKKLKKPLGGVIGGGFDPIYLIAQRLVKHSNDDGFLVGSRGSVGSSFVATMMGITEVNPLPPHYRCATCKCSIFENESGEPLALTYLDGYDLPDKDCPNCHTKMIKDGHDMPFATFLGFNADKVPDIDLNFSDLNQADAHAYTKVLFGSDNVYRAGTVGTVADKTAYGYVKGYFEDKGITGKRSAEIERLALGITGCKRTTGQHPGGIVVVPDYKEVYDFTPFQYPADDVTAEWKTTHFDYHSIESCLLKLDILGHSDPTQLRLIQLQSGTDILKVPLDDRKTMSIFSNPEVLGVTKEKIMCNTGTLGIPEFGTPFTIQLVEDTKPKTFAELIKISGLAHGTDVWLNNAQLLVHDKIVPFKDVIGCRDDIMVNLMTYGLPAKLSFDIMEFVRKGRAAKAKKPGDKELWQDYKKTMKEYKVPDWYIDSCSKIQYMFPKAHAAAYVINAFRIAWYKVHMPVYFYASWMSSKATDVDVEAMIKGYDAIKEKITEITNKGYDASNKELGQLESLKVALEATARGIQFLPLELDKSGATEWIVKDKTSIYPPFSSIDGLGDTVANNIVEERKKKEFLSIEDLQKRAKISTSLIEKMRTMHILDHLDESSQLSLF